MNLNAVAAHLADTRVALSAFLPGSPRALPCPTVLRFHCRLGVHRKFCSFGSNAVPTCLTSASSELNESPWPSCPGPGQPALPGPALVSHLSLSSLCLWALSTCADVCFLWTSGPLASSASPAAECLLTPWNLDALSSRKLPLVPTVALCSPGSHSC